MALPHAPNHPRPRWRLGAPEGPEKRFSKPGLVPMPLAPRRPAVASPGPVSDGRDPASRRASRGSLILASGFFASSTCGLVGPTSDLPYDATHTRLSESLAGAPRRPKFDAV